MTYSLPGRLLAEAPQEQPGGRTRVERGGPSARACCVAPVPRRWVQPVVCPPRSRSGRPPGRRRHSWGKRLLARGKPRVPGHPAVLRLPGARVFAPSPPAGPLGASLAWPRRRWLPFCCAAQLRQDGGCGGAGSSHSRRLLQVQIIAFVPKGTILRRKKRNRRTPPWKAESPFVAVNRRVRLCSFPGRNVDARAPCALMNGRRRRSISHHRAHGVMQGRSLAIHLYLKQPSS